MCVVVGGQVIRGRSRVGVIAGVGCEGACVECLLVVVVCVSDAFCGARLVVGFVVVVGGLFCCSSIFDVDVVVVAVWLSLFTLDARRWRKCVFSTGSVLLNCGTPFSPFFAVKTQRGTEDAWWSVPLT